MKPQSLSYTWPWLVRGVVVLACGLGAVPARAAKLSLQDALNYALEHAPSLAQAREQRAIRGWQQDQVRAKFLPSLDLSTSQGYARSLPEGLSAQATPAGGAAPAGAGFSNPLFSQLNLTATELLYDNGETLTQRDISSANLTLSELAYGQARDDVLLTVIRAYYTLAQAELLLRTNQEQAALMDKQLRLVTTLYRQGLKPQKEYLRLESQVQKPSLDLMNGEASRRAAVIDLRKAMGAEGGDQALDFTVPTPEQALRESPKFPSREPKVEETWAAKSARLDDEVAAAQVELARRKNLPVVTLGAGASYLIPDYLDPGRMRGEDRPLGWNVTLGVSYNLWDGGSRRHDIDIAAAQRRVKAEDNDDKLKAMVADIAKTMETLRALKASVALQKRLIALEQQNFDNLAEDYRQGKVPYLDLITGLGDLLGAKVSYFTTYVNIQQALAQYRYYEGTIHDGLAAP